MNTIRSLQTIQDFLYSLIQRFLSLETFSIDKAFNESSQQNSEKKRTPKFEMSLNGVWQLKEIVLQYCKHGGSSRGAREFMKSPELIRFASENPQIKFIFANKNGRHPHLRGTYINDIEHTHDLRKKEPDVILQKMYMLRNQSGRSTHNFRRWSRPKSEFSSIQGRWHPEVALPSLKDIKFTAPSP